METKEKIKVIVKALDSKKAKDIKVIKIDDITSICDYFVIATGTSSTQVRTLADETDYQMGLCGVNPQQIEGNGKNSWILIDYIDVVVHVFDRQAREFYDLDKLWADGEEIDIDEFLGEQE